MNSVVFQIIAWVVYFSVFAIMTGMSASYKYKKDPAQRKKMKKMYVGGIWMLALGSVTVIAIWLFSAFFQDMRDAYKDLFGWLWSIPWGWKCFISYIIFGLLYWFFHQQAEEYEDYSVKKRKTMRILSYGSLAIGGTAALILVFYAIGWLWYYFCGGFLVIDVAEDFFEKVIYGLITVIGAGFWIGLILILLGKMK